MDVQEALTGEAAMGVRRRLADHADKRTGGIARDAEDRVRDEVWQQALLGQLGKGRVEEERAIVVDDLQDGQLTRAVIAIDAGVA